MKKNFFTVLCAAAITLASCHSEGDGARGLSAAGGSADEAVPVMVENLERSTFSQYQTYTASLHGLNEATRVSALNGVIGEVNFKVGDYVEKDQCILSFPGDTSSAQYYQSLASYEAAEKTYERMRNLFSSNGISRQDYDMAKTQYEVQQANWKAVSDMIHVKAPVTGFLTLLNVDEGDSVSPGDVLFTVSDYRVLTATLSVPDSRISVLATGQKVVASWEDYEIGGEVSRVNLSKDGKSKSFTVQILFENPDYLLPSGITAGIRINTLEHDGSIVLRSNQFITDRSGSYTFVARDDHAERRDLDLGLNQGFYYEVKNGLAERDLLITEGLMRLEDQAKIIVING